MGMRSRPFQAPRRPALLWFGGSLVGLQLGLLLAVHAWRPQLRDPGYAVKGAVLMWFGESLVGVQLGLALAAYAWWPQLRDPAYADKAAVLRGRLRDPAPRPLTVVMLGSSRTDYGLQGRPLEERFCRELGRPV